MIKSPIRYVDMCNMSAFDQIQIYRNSRKYTYYFASNDNIIWCYFEKFGKWFRWSQNYCSPIVTLEYSLNDITSNLIREQVK